MKIRIFSILSAVFGALYIQHIASMEEFFVGPSKQEVTYTFPDETTLRKSIPYNQSFGMDKLRDALIEQVTSKTMTYKEVVSAVDAAINKITNNDFRKIPIEIRDMYEEFVPLTANILITKAKKSE